MIKYKPKENHHMYTLKVIIVTKRSVLVADTPSNKAFIYNRRIKAVICVWATKATAK